MERPLNFVVPFITPLGIASVFTLFVRPSLIPNAGLGIFCDQLIPAGTLEDEYVGYFIGEIINSKYSWAIYPELENGVIDFNAKPIGCIDSYAIDHWTRYVNGSSSPETANLYAWQEKQKIYYHNLRDILIGEELLVWYGQDYYDTFCKNKTS